MIISIGQIIVPMDKCSETEDSLEIFEEKLVVIDTILKYPNLLAKSLQGCRVFRTFATIVNNYEL